MKKTVLFLCTNNSCRSQMAEGILRDLAGDSIEIFSAGVNPTQVHPLAISVMKEIGIDISGHRSKSLSEFGEKEFDCVITVCDSARQSCPFFPGKVQMLHWDLEDPAAAHGGEKERFGVFRKVRSQIKDKIQKFLAETMQNSG